MDVGELKDWLAGRLDAPARVIELIWTRLDAAGIIQDYEIEAAGREHVLREAREEVRYLREGAAAYGPSVGKLPAGRTSPEGPPRVFEVKLDRNAEERITAFSEAEARRADRHPDVERYRREVRGGRLLADEEAREIVSRFRFSPDGKPLPGTEDEELRQLAEKLARAFRWESRDAMLYVLSGRAPRINPFDVTATYRGYGRGSRRAVVALTLEPWISVEDVRRVYREVQHQILGKDNRRSADHNLRLLRFVEERTTPEGERQTWRKLMEAWNEEHPDHRYGDVERFKYLYKRTRKQIVYPQHNFLGTGAGEQEPTRTGAGSGVGAAEVESTDDWMRRMGADVRDDV